MFSRKVIEALVPLVATSLQIDQISFLPRPQSLSCPRIFSGWTQGMLQYRTGCDFWPRKATQSIPGQGSETTPPWIRRANEPPQARPAWLTTHCHRWGERKRGGGRNESRTIGRHPLCRAATTCRKHQPSVRDDEPEGEGLSQSHFRHSPV
jgi:hypothetical protein